MLDFAVTQQLCTRCGLCRKDCPARIIAMEEGTYPFIPSEKEPACYRCQHCLAVCPTGALSILGISPDDCTPLADNYPSPEQLETLIRGRRSVRRYRDENLDPQLLRQLLEVAWQAPTGMNARQVRFTVVDDREKMNRLRDEVMQELGFLVRNRLLPEGMGFFEDFVRVWEERQQDIIFRGAPHLLIASTPKESATPAPDCLIALSYFELYAQACGVGTVWNGIAKWALHDLLPQSLHRLGIPEDHVIGYFMSFGRPAVQYTRTVLHRDPLIFPAAN